MNIQYELFEPATEEWIQEKRVQGIEEGLTKLRKGIFSRHHEQGKEVIRLERKVDQLQRTVEELREMMIARVK